MGSTLEEEETVDCGNEAPRRVVQPRDLPISPQRSPALLRSRHQLKPSGSFVRDGKSALWGNFANSQQLLAPPHVGGLQFFLNDCGKAGNVSVRPQSNGRAWCTHTAVHPPRGAAHTARSAGGARAGTQPDGPRRSRRRQVTSAGQEGQPGGGCGGTWGRPGCSQKGVI